MIILEGPDGSGKTTLAQFLSEELNVEIAPKVVNSDAQVEEGVDLLRWVRQELESWPKYIIYDRFPLISDFIYGPMLRGKVAPGFEDIEHQGLVWEILRAANPIIIYCLPPLDVVKINVEATHSEEFVWSLDPIYYHYFTMWRGDLNALRYDYTRDLGDRTSHRKNILIKIQNRTERPRYG